MERPLATRVAVAAAAAAAAARAEATGATSEAEAARAALNAGTGGGGSTTGDRKLSELDLLLAKVEASGREENDENDENDETLEISAGGSAAAGENSMATATSSC